MKGEGLTGGQEGFKSSLKTSHTREPLEEQSRKAPLGPKSFRLLRVTPKPYAIWQRVAQLEQKKEKKSQQQHLLVAAW